jgi:hypothetical protein
MELDDKLIDAHIAELEVMFSEPAQARLSVLRRVVMWVTLGCVFVTGYHFCLSAAMQYMTPGVPGR